MATDIQSAPATPVFLVSAPPQEVTAQPAPAWGPTRRVLFRFLFIYLGLYNLPFLGQYIPGAEVILGPYQELWHRAAQGVGRILFGVEITVFTNGSGDTTYDYVQMFCLFVLAAALAALWSLLSRGQNGYPRLGRALRVYVRFMLAAAMITYGAVKIIPSQFPSPSLDRLIQPFGDASPMGLLWTFMGASASYSIFAGAGEILGGLLLTTRRTTLLGALVCIGVLANVVMLNFSYDVPVKLYSSHLLAEAVFLAAPDLKRLIDFFVLGRGATPLQLRPLLGRKWLDRTVVVLRTLLVAGFTALWLYNAHQMRQQYGDLSPRSPLYGIWNIEEFTINGRARPPLLTDATRWRRLIFDHPGMMAVQLMSDSRQRYLLQLDAKARTLTLTRRDDPAWKATLTYEQPEDRLLTLTGKIDGHEIRAKAWRIDEHDFLLRSRGFHWINEYPFNR